MKQEIAEQWVAALRSGQYKQGRHQLKNDLREFCVLGVLCDVHAKSTGDSYWHGNSYQYTKTELPPVVMKWAGMSDNEGALPTLCYGEKEAKHVSLAGLNDGLITFSELANIITVNWKYL